MHISFRYSKLDLLTCLLLIAVLLAASVPTLHSGHFWGDDQAAYLTTAFAIAEGRLEEQNQLNLFMHPSPLPDEAPNADSLVYVWGFPLMLVPIFRLVGFDTNTYHTLVYYKLPVAVCFALLGAVLFLFYRRRFSYLLSLTLSVLFCLSTYITAELQIISPELPFLLFFMLSLLLLEIFLSQTKPWLRVLNAMLLGCAMWAAYVTRLNGTALVAVVAAAQAIWLIQHRKAFSRNFPFHLIPYFCFFSLIAISRLFLPAPTSNLSDIGSADLDVFLVNARAFLDMVYDWFATLFSRNPGAAFRCKGVGLCMLLLAMVGIARCGIRKNLHFSVLVVATFLTVCMLDYAKDQGLRYLFTILPLLLLFAAHGAQQMLRWLLPHFDDLLCRYTRCAATCFCIAVTLLVTGQMTFSTVQAFLNRGSSLQDSDAYSTYAVDLYHYIQNETEEDAVIAYWKPRILYLNTGRVSFKPQLAPEYVPYYMLNRVFPYQPRYTPLDTADYLLLYDDIANELLYHISLELGGYDRLELVYENPKFEFYRILPQA